MRDGGRAFVLRELRSHPLVAKFGDLGAQGFELGGESLLESFDLPGGGAPAAAHRFGLLATFFGGGAGPSASGALAPGVGEFGAPGGGDVSHGWSLQSDRAVDSQAPGRGYLTVRPLDAGPLPWNPYVTGGPLVRVASWRLWSSTRRYCSGGRRGYSPEKHPLAVRHIYRRSLDKSHYVAEWLFASRDHQCVRRVARFLWRPHIPCYTTKVGLLFVAPAGLHGWNPTRSDPPRK